MYRQWLPGWIIQLCRVNFRHMGQVSAPGWIPQSLCTLIYSYQILSSEDSEIPSWVPGIPTLGDKKEGRKDPETICGRYRQDSQGTSVSHKTGTKLVSLGKDGPFTLDMPCPSPLGHPQGHSDMLSTLAVSCISLAMGVCVICRRYNPECGC